MPSTLTTDAARTMAAQSAQVRRINGLERHIKRIVDDSAPPLTDEQRSRLARILAPTVTNS